MVFPIFFVSFFLMSGNLVKVLCWYLLDLVIRTEVSVPCKYTINNASSLSTNQFKLILDKIIIRIVSQIISAGSR